MRACASFCQSSSTSGSIASASLVSPRQSSMSSRSRWCGFSTSRQPASTAVRSGRVIENSRPGADDLGLGLRLRGRSPRAPRRAAASRCRSAAARAKKAMTSAGGSARRHLPLAGAAQGRRGPGQSGCAARKASYSSQFPAPSRSRVQSTMSFAIGLPVQAASVAASGQSPVAAASSACGEERGLRRGLRRGRRGARRAQSPASRAGSNLVGYPMLVPRAACSAFAGLYHSVWPAVSTPTRLRLMRFTNRFAPVSGGGRIARPVRRGTDVQRLDSRARHPVPRRQGGRGGAGRAGELARRRGQPRPRRGRHHRRDPDPQPRGARALHRGGGQDRRRADPGDRRRRLEQHRGIGAA